MIDALREAYDIESVELLPSGATLVTTSVGSIVAHTAVVMVPQEPGWLAHAEPCVLERDMRFLAFIDEVGR